MLVSDGVSNLEGNGVIVEVEVRWIFSHENITKDEVVEAFWEVHGLNTKEAFGLSTLGDLENVIVGGEFVISSINGEGHGWEIFDTFAGFWDSNTLDQWVNNLLWSNEEGSS